MRSFRCHASSLRFAAWMALSGFAGENHLPPLPGMGSFSDSRGSSRSRRYSLRRTCGISTGTGRPKP
jgi:hypothetical protein